MIFEHRIWPDQPVNVSLPDEFRLDVIGTCTRAFPLTTKIS